MSNQTVPAQTNNVNQLIEKTVGALLAGAKSLYRTPIVVNKKLGSKINRLGLHCWVNNTNTNSRFLVIHEIMKHYKGVNCGIIATAIRKIQSERLAFVDSYGIAADDVKAVQELLEKVIFARQENSTAKLDTGAKIYIRDLNCPKNASKGSVKAPVIAPDWLTSEVETQGEQLEEMQQEEEEELELAEQSQD